MIPKRYRRCDATPRRANQKDETIDEVRTRFRSALQLLPQGGNGAALTMLERNSHAALLLRWCWTSQSIAAGASKINSAEVENHRRQRHRKQAVKSQVGKPVRNTTKPGSRPHVGRRRAVGGRLIHQEFDPVAPTYGNSRHKPYAFFIAGRA